MKVLRNNYLRNEKYKPYKLLLPSMLTLYTLIGIGVFSAFKETFQHADEAMQIFSSSEFYTSLGLSMRLALLSTGLSILISILILFGLFLIDNPEKRSETKSFAYKPADSLNRLFQTPMLIPYIVAGYLVFLTFGQSGLFSRISYALGFTSSIGAFPALINTPSGFGIVLAFVWKTAPFMILMLYPAMISLDKKYLDMSRIFGMAPKKYFWSVLLPHMASTVAFSGFIVFAYTLTSFEIPFMLGATYPKTLSVAAYQMYTGGSLDERYMALTMSLVLFIISLILGYLAFKHAQGYQKHLKGDPHK